MAPGLPPVAAQRAVAAPVLDEYQLGVAARYDETDSGKRDVRLGQPNGEDVALDVVDSDHGDVERVRQRLGERDADQKTSYETRAARDRDALEGVVADSRAVERLLHDGLDGADMCARGVLGHNAAELRMDELGGHDVRENRAAVRENGRRGLVTRCVDAKDYHVVIRWLRGPFLLQCDGDSRGSHVVDLYPLRNVNLGNELVRAPRKPHGVDEDLDVLGPER